MARVTCPERLHLARLPLTSPAPRPSAAAKTPSAALRLIRRFERSSKIIEPITTRPASPRKHRRRRRCSVTDMEMRRYNMLVRVRDFGQARRELFPEGSVGAQAFAAVTTAVSELGGHAVRKMS